VNVSITSANAVCALLAYQGTGGTGWGAHARDAVVDLAVELVIQMDASRV
jgi:hypothetical protein